MTNAALINIGDDVIDTLTKFKTNPSQRSVKLTIERECLRASNVVPRRGSYQTDFNGLREQLQPREPCFLVVRLEKTASHPEFLFVVFIPSDCPVRPRTIFASGRVPVQRRLTQIFTGMTDYFIDEIRALAYDAFIAASRKDDSAMTAEERMFKQAADDCAVGVVHLPEHDTFTWPVDDALQTRLRQFGTGGGANFVAGKASPTGGAITLAGEGSRLADIDGSEPRYIAIRYNNRGRRQQFFLLYCPDTAHPRQKMTASTCKRSFLKACETIGIAFERNFEIRDREEFNDANLEKLVSQPIPAPRVGEARTPWKPITPVRKW